MAYTPVPKYVQGPATSTNNAIVLWDGTTGAMIKDSGIPISSLGITIGGTVTGGTAGSILFVGAGPVLAQDNANLFWDDSNNRLGIGINSALGAKLQINTGATTEKAIVIKASASQTADLQDWIDSSGNLLLGVAASGYIYSQGPALNWTSQLIPQEYGFKFRVPLASNDLVEMPFDAPGTTPGKYVFRLENRSFACYTGANPEWQFGDGNLNGFWLLSSQAGGGYYTSVDPCEWSLLRPTSFNVSISKIAAARAVWIDPVNATRTGRMLLGAYYITSFQEAIRIDASSTFPTVSIGGTAVASSTQIIITAPTSTYKGLVVKGASSQSANLQEWQDSSGTVLAYVDKDGGFVFNENSLDVDCRIEGNGDANLVYTDAGNDRVGIGTSSPTGKFSVTNLSTTDDILNLKDNATEVFVVEDGGTIDITGIAAGTPNFRITATSDTPTVTWGAAAGNEVSAAPAGYLEISVGGNPRYIPFWA